MFSRYANPNGILETSLKHKKFHKFIIELLTNFYETKAWEVWIHKIYDKSFTEFKKSLMKKEEVAPEPINIEKIKSTIESSKSMLESFTPITEGRG